MPYAELAAVEAPSVDGRSGRAGAAAEPDVVVRAEDAEGVAVDMVDEDRSAPAPVPARSQGFGGDGIESVMVAVGYQRSGICLCPSCWKAS